MLKIIHLAHACFLIENDKEKLIIDPSDNSFGYEFKDEKVNYLLISHKHWDHINTDNIIVEENKETFKIRIVDSFHDEENGNLRGNNLIHIIETEGIRICHLGDLGHILSDEQVKSIGQIDILLIPTGGIFTINSKQAIKVVNQLKPDIVIPMHYKTNYWGEDKGIDSVEKFIDNIKDYKILKLDSNQLDYKKISEKIVYIF